MTYEQFKQYVEAPLSALDGLTPSNENFWKRIIIKAVIARTMRMTLREQEFADRYLNEQAKAVNEGVIIESSNSL